MAQEGSFYSAEPQVFSVELGNVTLFVNSWEISSQRIFAEQSSVTGESIISNSSDRLSRIHLEGIWVTDEKPQQLIMTLDEFMHDNTPFQLMLREIVFEECRLVKYSATEKGSEAFIKISMDLISCISPKEAGGIEE